MQSRSETTGKTEIKRIVSTSHSHVDMVVSVALADAKSGHVVETLTATRQHPFCVEGKGFVPAGGLAIGNSIVTRAGPPLVVKSVTWKRRAEGYNVYNFVVEDDHTYFVGKAHGGAWVHNPTGLCGYTDSLFGDDPLPVLQNSSATGGTYKLVDPITGTIVRTGRASDLAARMNDHANDPLLKDYKFVVDKYTDDYAAQRGREQILHNLHNPPLNKIRPIDPDNPNQGEYIRAGRDL